MIVCICQDVEEYVIVDCIRRGINTVPELEEHLHVVRGCGYCQEPIEELILKHKHDEIN